MRIMLGIGFIASLSLFVVVVTLAGGTTYTLVTDNGEWGDPDSWDQGSGYPGQEDTAVIPAGKHVQILGHHDVKVLKLQKSGTSIGVARIRGTASLTLHGSSTEFDGELRFELDDAEPPNRDGELVIAENLTLTGSGRIVGHDEEFDPFEIDWTPGLVKDDGEGLPEVLTIEGSPSELDLQIEGAIEISVRLVNNSLVYVAHVEDTLSLTDHPKSGTGDWWVDAQGQLVVDVSVSGSGDWYMLGKPIGDQASVQINAPCTSLTGAVYIIDGAVLDVNASFSTTGYAEFGDPFPASSDPAEIRVAPGAVAQFSIPDP